jgi:hypothetical protein
MDEKIPNHIYEEQVAKAERLADAGDPTDAYSLLKSIEANKLECSDEFKARLLAAARKPNTQEAEPDPE